MSDRFSGKTVIITGGASGIGRHTALSFAKEKAKIVIVTARSIEKAKETVKEIEKLGSEAIFVQCDVSVESQVEAMVKKTVDTFGSLDFAFNNAGVGPDGVTIPFAPLTDVTEADWDSVVDTNLKGNFLCMKHELRQMRAQGYGCIVNTASTSGIKMIPEFGGYCPAKAGVIALTKCAALENKDKGIRVNVVCPGPTEGTGMFERMSQSSGSKPKGAPPAEGGLYGRITGTPDDIARVVLWLCSDDASFIDGNVFSVDGGLDII